MRQVVRAEATPVRAGSLSAFQQARPEHGVQVARASAAVLTAAAVAFYIYFVVRFSTNGVFWDEWNWVGLMSKAYAGSLTYGDMWGQHNENRMLFPNLLALVLGRATGFNDLAFIYLGAAFLVATGVLLAFACRRELSRHPFAYMPAALILFSVAQYENSLWSFQLAWFLAVVCIAGVLALLTVRRLDSWRFVGAIALAVVASYSTIGGLTIWAAGLVALFRPGVTVWRRSVWCIAGIATVGLYLVNYQFEPVGGLWSHLPQAAQGFFVAVGSIVPILSDPTTTAADLTIPTVLGVFITIAAGFVLVSWIMQRPRDRVLTIASALIIVGLQFDVMLMPSRLSTDVLNATLSRYTTFNLLLLAGVYVGAVRILILAREKQPRRKMASWALAGLVIAVVCIQVPAAIHAGLLGGARTYAMHAEAADITANYPAAPQSLVAIYCYPPSYMYFAHLAAFLEANRLNVFGDGESAGYQRSGVLDGGVVSAPLPVPPEFGAVRSDPSEWRAWLALTSVYDQRPDLQAAFPGPTAATSRQMVAWAVHFGVGTGDPRAAPVLEPYLSQYRAWLAEAAT